MHEILEASTVTIQSFNDFIYEQRRRQRKHFSSILNMYNGDMWDKGKGYIGPLPVREDDNASVILSNIKRMFTSRNCIVEIVDRVVDGLLSKSPNWEIYNAKKIENNPKLKRKIPSMPKVTFDTSGERVEAKDEPIDRKIQEAELILSELWSQGLLSDRLKDSVTSMLLTGKGKLRIYFPKRKIGQVNNFIEAVKYVKVEFISNEESVLLDDGVDKLSVVEISSKQRKWELSFTDDSGNTYIAALQNKPTTQVDQEDLVSDANTTELSTAIEQLKKENLLDLSSPLDLNGNITVDEIKCKPFVTESMLQNNRALNLSLSLGVGILVESGYAEMVTTNVALKTKKVTTSDGDEVEVPVAIERGPTSLTNLVGEQTMNPQTGEIQFEQPGVYWKEPSKLDPFIGAEELYYRQILSEAKQLYILIVSDAKASGESRVQARQDFLKKIQRYKPSLDLHGGWLLNTLLQVIAIIAGKAGYFKDYKVLYDSKVSAGELSADEKNVVISMYTAEPPLISRETAMVLLGTEEPLIEVDKIRLDQAEKLANQVTRLSATAKFGNMVANGQPKELPDGQKTDPKATENK